MIDQKLIEALKQKDEKAFENIYSQTKRGVYAIIFSVTKNHPSTEDIMQDVYMKMMTSIDLYQPKTNFYNWLLTIAKNQAIDYYRREKRITHVDANDFDGLYESNEYSPDEETKFQLMINTLDEEHRTIILLRIVDDMKFKEIAKLLDKPLGTVLWQYQEALKTLKRLEG